MEKATIQRLFKQYYAQMYRVAWAILNDEEDSKDAVSEVFVSLLREDMVLIPSTEEHYLMTSVRNRCFKRLRHEEIKQKMIEDYTPDEEEDEDERIADIIEFVVSNLPPVDQRIFTLRFSVGYSYDEIAQELGFSKVSVWKHLSSIIKDIKKHFNQSDL